MGRRADLSNYSAEDIELWERIRALDGRAFKTRRGLLFTISVRGNELFFDRRSKSVTMSTVAAACRRLRERQSAGLPVTGPRQLDVFGASYLWPLLEELGLVERPPRERTLWD